MQNSNYFSSLNFFRALSGLGVCISHYFFYINNIVFFEYVSFVFVEFFFILSGFVLSPQLIMINNIGKLKIFFFRRWVRTLPLFFLCVLVYSFLFEQFNLDTVKYFFLIQNIFPNFLETDYISVLWSLSVEEYFYVLFPTLLIFVSNKKILKISYIIILFYLFLTLLFSFQIDTSELRTNTILRLDSIAYGVVLYFLFKQKIKLSFYFTSITTALLLFYFYVNFINKDFNNFESFFYITTLKIFSFCACLIFIRMENFFLKFDKFGRFLANLVYSSYLFHLIFIYFLKFYTLNPFISFMVYLMSLLVFTFCIYNFFEKPLNNLRPKYSG